MDKDDVPPDPGTDAHAEVAAYAVVAHGLLTSASVVVGLTSTLLERWDDLSDDRRRALVGTTAAQARTIHTVLHAMVTALPSELLEPLRDAIAGQIDAQTVDAAVADRSDDTSAASPNTSSSSSGTRPHSQR